MTKKTQKVQVVLAVNDQSSQMTQILLLKTNQKRGAFWQNVTGKVEEGETFEEAALREAIEETKLKIESIIDMVSLNLSFDFTDQRKRKVHEKCFLILLDEKWNVELDAHEHQDLKWINLNDTSEESVKFESNFEALKKAKLLLKNWEA